MTRPDLVIGIGNEHRGDDRAGLLVARALRGLGADDRARIVEHRGDGISLLDVWQGAHDVIVIDAMHTHRPIGAIVHLDASEENPGLALGGQSTHAFGPAEAIEMARVLGRLPPRLEIVAIEGKRFSIGAEISPEVVRAADEATDRIARRLVPPSGDGEQDRE